MEETYPGISDQIRRFENALLPFCSFCGSEDTADVQAGIMGRTILLSGMVRKFQLVPNRTGRNRYFCNTCRRFFISLSGGEPIGVIDFSAQGDDG